MRLINWNIERRGPAKWQASSLMKEIAALRADVVALTEAHEGSTAELDGYEISARGVCWASDYADSERKVLLWSRHPWTEIETPSELGKIGGVIVGKTLVDGATVRIMCVCIPYQHASPYGAVEKSPYFAEHKRFLVELRQWLDEQGANQPSIVVGDFNRGVPRDWGPHDSYELLEKTFSGYCFITGGLTGPIRKKGVEVQRQTIDHVVAPPGTVATQVSALTAIDPIKQKSRSDHFGVLVDLTLPQLR